jgi:hypothetical protein
MEIDNMEEKENQLWLDLADNLTPSQHFIPDIDNVPRGLLMEAFFSREKVRPKTVEEFEEAALLGNKRASLLRQQEEMFRKGNLARKQEEMWKKRGVRDDDRAE